MKKLLYLWYLALSVIAGAQVKVTELPALTGGGAASADVLPIIDVSAGAGGSKKITLAELFSTPVPWQGVVITGQYGGTGINNNGKTITLGGNLTTNGANALALTTTGNTNVSLPTSGTLATTTQVDGKADGDLGNVNPLAGREALEVGEPSAGLHHVPLKISRTWKDGRVADSRPPLTIMLWGDSLMAGMGSGDLLPEQIFWGWKLMGVDRAAVSAGTATLGSDGAWLHPFYQSIAQSSTVEWIPDGQATAGVQANRIGVLYYKGASSANEFTIQYNQGAGWTTPSGGTINTSLAATNVAWAEFTLGNTGNVGLPTRVRVTTGTGKTAKVIGMGAWYGDTEAYAGKGGFVLVNANYQGISAGDIATVANATPTAIGTPVADMQVNLVLHSFWDPPNAWDEGGAIDDVKAAIDASIVADWCLITGNPMGPSPATGMTEYSNDEIAKLDREAGLAWVKRQNQNVVDLYPAWGDYATAVATGFMDGIDEIHPSATGKVAKRKLISDVLSRALYAQKDGTFVGMGPNGARYYMSASQYSIRFGPDPMYPTASAVYEFQGGAGNGINLQSRSSTNVAKALTWYYTGEAASGLEFGWYSNDNPQNGGSDRTAVKYAATGSYSTGNLVQSSDWPLVQTTKLVNTAPSTPAAGSVTSFFRLNGSSKVEMCVKTPDGTTHVVWTQP